MGKHSFKWLCLVSVWYGFMVLDQPSLEVSLILEHRTNSEPSCRCDIEAALLNLHCAEDRARAPASHQVGPAIPCTRRHLQQDRVGPKFLRRNQTRCSHFTGLDWWLSPRRQLPQRWACRRARQEWRLASRTLSFFWATSGPAIKILQVKEQLLKRSSMPNRWADSN